MNSFAGSIADVAALFHFIVCNPFGSVSSKVVSRAMSSEDGWSFRRYLTEIIHFGCSSWIEHSIPICVRLSWVIEQ